MQRNQLTTENPNLSVAEEMEKEQIALNEFHEMNKPERYNLQTKSGSITLYDFQLSNFIYGIEGNVEMLKNYGGNDTLSRKIVGWIEEELNDLKAQIAHRVAKDGGLK